MTDAVYCLVESETQTLLYVGKSNSPWHRISQHKRNFRNRYSCEIDMLILEEDCADWQSSERYWISLFKSIHEIFIVNKIEGGNAPNLNTSSIGGIMSKFSRKGKPNGKKGIKNPKVSEANRNRKGVFKHSESHNLKQSISRKIYIQELKSIQKDLNVSYSEARLIWRQRSLTKV